MAERHIWDGVSAVERVTVRVTYRASDGLDDMTWREGVGQAGRIAMLGFSMLIGALTWVGMTSPHWLSAGLHVGAVGALPLFVGSWGGDPLPLDAHKAASRLVVAVTAPVSVGVCVAAVAVGEGKEPVVLGVVALGTAIGVMTAVYSVTLIRPRADASAVGLALPALLGLLALMGDQRGIWLGLLFTGLALALAVATTTSLRVGRELLGPSVTARS